MLAKIAIQHFKSIVDLSVDVARFNVLIGENGAGKSNFLEALAVYSAVSARKADHEFLAARGIRVLDLADFISKFNNVNLAEVFLIDQDGLKFSISVEKDIKYDKNGNMRTNCSTPVSWEEVSKITKEIENNENSLINNKFELIQALEGARFYQDFYIYAPENSALRNFVSEGQILPLGIKGEGLYKFLYEMQQNEPECFADIMSCLDLFDWVDINDDGHVELQIGDTQNPFVQKISVNDRHLLQAIDQRSANEGFLLVLFYAALFCSKKTPTIFAVDNIDAALNPRLCQELMVKLYQLAIKYDKQVFMTAHNPAILDGLNLFKQDQALFIVERNRKGHTQLRHVTVDSLPKALTSGENVNRLSEAFIRGYLGGLPKNI